jgi:hypothetical protein
MVNNDSAQLYTIEGFAAALIMVITAFLVLNATSVYTAGDTHITDMQLEALGTDALKMMDTPVSSAVPSPLVEIITYTPVGSMNDTFKTMFMHYTNVSGSGPTHDIQYSAGYTCQNLSTNNITSYPLSYSRNLSGEEHTVKATKWVIINKKDPTGLPESFCGLTDRNRAVLVEVLLWRD